MKMKFLGKFVALFAACGLAGAAAADTYVYNGQTISYTGTGATATPVGDDLVIKFTSSGSLTLPVNYNARILAVGGGGAGGNPRGTSNTAGGGGGAGEMVDRSDISLASGTYTISVGAGGTFSQNNNNAVGGNGGESYITVNGRDVLRVKGGGGGGYGTTTQGSQGRSSGGGGGQTNNGSTDAGTLSTGDGWAYSGGTGHQYSGGGGGGAGGVGGAAARRGAAGAGGAARISNITGSDKAYAGGGGGGAGYYNGNLTAGSGGSAGNETVGAKGAARGSAAGTAAANTGSGGGGGTYANNTRQYPSAGAAGIVVVRISTVKVCQIGTTKYETFEEAVAAAKDDDTIELLADIALGADVTIDKDVKITSSGTKRTISRNAANASLNIAGNVAFDNVTIDGGSGDEAILSLETGGVITTIGNTTLSQNKIALQGQTITFANGQLMRASEADGVMVKYTQNGTLNLPSQAKADYLLVGGGGGGGGGYRSGMRQYYYGDGGDGGKVVEGTSDSLPGGSFPAGSYAITVGTGGPGGNDSGSKGADGKPSSVSGVNLTAPGGAGGAGGNGKPSRTSSSAGTPATGTTAKLDGVSYGKGGAAADTSSDPVAGGVNTGNGGQGGWAAQSGYSYNVTAGAAGGSGVVIINIKSMKDVVNAGMRTVHAGESITLTNDVAWGEGWTVRSLDESVATVAKSGSDVTVTGAAVGTTTVRIENDSSIYNYTVKVLKKTYSKGILLSPSEGERQVFDILGNVESVVVADPTVATAEVRDGKLYVTAKKAETTTVTVETDAATYTVQVNPVVNKTIELAKNASTQTTYSYTFDEIYRVEGDGGSVVNVSRDGNTVTFTAGEAGTSSVVRVYGKIDGDKGDGGTEAILAYTVIVKEISGGIVPIADTYVEYVGATKVIADGSDVILVFTNANDLGSIRIPDPYRALVDILAVGGGGAGGTAMNYGGAGGGGGAGGYSYVTDKVLEPGQFFVDVGKGGPAINSLVAGGGAQGACGSPSILSNVYGYAFASAAGGGGGGGPGPELTIDGLPGGSGGGATFRGSLAGAAGKAVEGQGRNGGKPTDSTVGAGGGGAGGLGSADRTGGAGLENDISGENVLYAQGGAGGVTYQQQRGTNGQGPGFGGNGGSGAPGGAGGDGAIVVHIKDVYRNIKVPVPGTNDVYSADGTLLQAGLVTPRFVWKNGEVYVALDYEGKEFRSSTDAHPRLYSDAFEVIGTISTNCFETGKFDAEGSPILGGVGYYNFTLKLKEGYCWEDGRGPDTAGSTASKLYRWVVVADESVIDAAIDIHKTVSWSDTSNATVAVTTYSSPETAGRPPKVLFLGTLCNGHGMDKSVVTESLKTMVSVANVDYYLYSVSSGNTEDNPLAQGQLKVGEVNKVDNINPSFDAPKHYAMTAFYKRLYKQLVDPATKQDYDYVVFEFDGSRVSDGYTTAYQNEAAVVAALKKYYDEDSVIWIVDNCYSGSSEPWQSDYWRPNSYWNNNMHNNMGDVQYRGLVGLFDPKHYKQGGTRAQIAVESKTWNPGTWQTSYGGVNNGTVYANDRWDLQATYDNVDEVTALLKRAIKVKPYNLTLRDKIVSPEKGLTLTGVTIQVTTNGTDKTAQSAGNDWADLITWRTDGTTKFTPAMGIKGASIAVDMPSNLVQTVISNVDFQVWTRVKINVVDDGKFRTTDDAIYNQRTGKWEKNPNEGKAFAEMFDSLGLAMNIEGEAETDTPWDFPAYMVTASVVNGEAFVGGEATLSKGYGPGTTVTVYYRGKPGYKIASVTVDGNPVDIDAYPSSYTFPAISDNHNVAIVYEPFFGTVESTPVTNVYDGVMHFYDVTLSDWDPVYSNEVRFATEEFKDDPDAYTNAAVFAELYGQNWTTAYNPDELSDVGDHRFYYRVYVLQPGYGATFDEPGWVWVDTAMYGADESVILPAPLLVRPKDSDKIYTNDNLPDIGHTITGFIGEESEKDLGDVATNGWKVISVYKIGDGVGMYETWVADNPTAPSGERYALNEQRIPEGDPNWIEPGDESKPSNAGNYYFIPRDNFQPVELIPLSIGDVPQGPGLDPEVPKMDTGVDPAYKMYDGIPTNVTVEVTSHYVDRPSEPLVEGRDYTITYAIASADDPKNPSSERYDENPTFTHAGTNVVWYFVQPINGQELIYFPASNYQYVVITPRPLVLESHSQEWTYDGAAHAYDVITLNEGTLVNNDTLTTNTNVAITHVKDSVMTNTFDWEITSGEPGYGSAKGDYDVTIIEGGLKLNPKPITVGDKTYDPEQSVQPHGESGVEDAIKVYDGIPTNIIVTVTDPGDPTEYVIHYSTNYMGSVEKTEWTEEPFLFTNVTDTTVFYWVEPVGPNKDDYVPGVGYARVVITPAPVTVTADDAYVLTGDPKPETYTAKTGELACDEDEAKKDELIDQHTEHLDVPDYTPSSPVGVYDIVFTNLPTVITQGNYEVTYIPGTLHVEAKPRVLSLWITDHADAGNGMVHLQFEPKFTVPPVSLTDWATEASKNGRIWVFIGATPADTEDTKQVTTKTEGRAYGATLRDMENPVNEKMGRIWITVEEPLPDVNRAGKIVIVGE